MEKRLSFTLRPQFVTLIFNLERKRNKQKILKQAPRGGSGVNNAAIAKVEFGAPNSYCGFSQRHSVTIK